MSGCGGCNVNPEIKEVEKKEVELSADKEIVTLTENAAAKIKDFMAKGDQKGEGLRILVVPGGCAGYQYAMDFDEKKENDVVIEQHGVKLFIDKTSASHLVGTIIDFVDGLHESGFKINNPNAQQSCGCGKSFN